jgi:hypothetical protein
MGEEGTCESGDQEMTCHGKHVGSRSSLRTMAVTLLDSGSEGTGEAQVTKIDGMASQFA